MTFHIVKEELLGPVCGFQETHGSFFLGLCHHPGSQMERSCCSTCGSCWRSWGSWVTWSPTRGTLWAKAWPCGRPRSQSCCSACSTGLEAGTGKGPGGRSHRYWPLYVLSTSLQSLCSRKSALHAPNSSSTPHPQDREQVHRPNKVGISEFIPASFFLTLCSLAFQIFSFWAVSSLISPRSTHLFSSLPLSF